MAEDRYEEGYQEAFRQIRALRDAMVAAGQVPRFMMAVGDLAETRRLLEAFGIAREEPARKDGRASGKADGTKVDPPAG